MLVTANLGRPILDRSSSSCTVFGRPSYGEASSPAPPVGYYAVAAGYLRPASLRRPSTGIFTAAAFCPPSAHEFRAASSRFRRACTASRRFSFSIPYGRTQQKCPKPATFSDVIALTKRLNEAVKIRDRTSRIFRRSVSFAGKRRQFIRSGPSAMLNDSPSGTFVASLHFLPLESLLHYKCQTSVRLILVLG
jgi:hypothetical protein